MHPSIKITALAASLMFFASGFATGANVRSSAFLPSIAVNHDRNIAFTSLADGRLVAIDLSDGNIRWRSQRQLESVGLAKGSVIALAFAEGCSHCLQLVWLSDADGREQRTSKTITFPAWVSVEPAVGKQFTATVEDSGASLAVHWRASSVYVGGAHPSSQILKNFNKNAAGTFLIDARGEASAVATQSKAASMFPAALREVKTTTWWNCSEWSDTPIVDGDTMVALDLTARLDGQTLSARRWRSPSGQLDATRQLAQGSNMALQTSPDARYLFVHDGALQANAKASTSWHVYSLSTLRPVASVPYPPGQACANVAADAVVMLIEKIPPSNRGGSRARELVAYETSSGALRWSVELRGYPQQAPPR